MTLNCKPATIPLTTEWFHQLLREAHGLSLDVPMDSHSELHKTALKMGRIIRARLMVKP